MAGSSPHAWALAGLGLGYTGDRRDVAWARLVSFDCERQAAGAPRTSRHRDRHAGAAGVRPYPAGGPTRPLRPGADGGGVLVPGGSGGEQQPRSSGQLPGRNQCCAARGSGGRRRRPGPEPDRARRTGSRPSRLRLRGARPSWPRLSSRSSRAASSPLAWVARFSPLRPRRGSAPRSTRGGRRPSRCSGRWPSRAPPATVWALGYIRAASVRIAAHLGDRQAPSASWNCSSPGSRTRRCGRCTSLHHRLPRRGPVAARLLRPRRGGRGRPSATKCWRRTSGGCSPTPGCPWPASAP